MASGASFIARGYPLRRAHFKALVIEAIKHKGFSIVDVLQVCITYNNLYEDYNKSVKEETPNDLENREVALKAIRTWDYAQTKVPIPLGIFYQVRRKSFEEFYSPLKEDWEERSHKLQGILDSLT